ncbi:MAG: DUF58 domain-containing protein [Lachnospiraceae bacterium]|nr:DUF58 domain-containing protein [Lachnospiraceae bacterium]
MKWRRILFFILWISSLVGISCYGGVVSYTLFWGLTMLAVLAFFYLVCVFVGFKIYQEIESRVVVCKEPMPYFFALPNEGYYAFAGISVRLFSKLSYVTDMGEDEEYELLPGDKYEYHTRMICKYRGEYEVGVKEVILTDCFRLFRFRYRIDGTIKAQVYPRVLHLPEVESLKDTLNISSQMTPWQQTEPDVVTRAYIPGDALKYIHWKASAKEQQLKTRNMQGERKQDILLLYDTCRYHKEEYVYMPLENQILETVLALVSYLAEKNIDVKVCHSQRGLQECTVRGLNQFQIFYEQTAHVVFDEGEDMAATLEQLKQGGGLVSLQTMLVVSHRADTAFVGSLQKLAMGGMNIVWYLITDADAEEYLRQSNSRLRIVVLPIEGNLEDLL